MSGGILLTIIRFVLIAASHGKSNFFNVSKNHMGLDLRLNNLRFSHGVNYQVEEF